MTADRNNPEFLLLDWHLERLDDADRAWVEQELAKDAGLRAKNDQLRRLLEPLDAWQAPASSARLADKILSHVRRSEGHWDTSSEGAASSGAHAPASERPPAGRVFPFFRPREALAVAACLGFLALVGVPGMSALRERSQRIVCASHLGSIYRGLSAYQSDSNGSLPYAGPVTAAAWLPGPGRSFASNSRHSFLLAKLNFVPDLSDFLCPADAGGEPMLATARESAADFAHARNVSYDTMNLSGESPNVRPMPAVAYIADPNPLFVGGRFNQAVDPDRTNSPAHRGKGQTVLTVAGSAEFARTPRVGPANDNVWVMNGVRRYTGTETPSQPDDSFLVPGFPGQATR